MVEYFQSTEFSSLYFLQYIFAYKDYIQYILNNAYKVGKKLIKKYRKKNKLFGWRNGWRLQVVRFILRLPFIWFQCWPAVSMLPWVRRDKWRLCCLIPWIPRGRGCRLMNRRWRWPVEFPSNLLQKTKVSWIHFLFIVHITLNCYRSPLVMM